MTDWIDVLIVVIKAVAAIAIVVITVALTMLLRVRPSLRPLAATLVTGSALAALLVANHGATTSALELAPFKLDQEGQIRNLDIETRTLHRVIIDTAATHSADLRRGTTLVYLELRDEKGKMLERVPLRVGIETGDWSGNSRMESWQTRLSPDGDRLSRTYRSRLSWEPAVASVSALRLVRSNNLSDRVEVVVRRIEVSP